MCGCEYFINIKQLQLTLNNLRRRQIKISTTRSSYEYYSIVFSKDKPLHNRPNNAIKESMCSLAEGTIFP